ncbi:MAG: hypothetical protein AUF79_12450 [Crenarchaeota archaeon 13_1_20CM_2_51_8]|nr:MAG: hypothetical protein AUF79_12450 [Crenarchaeota archaeon 13_1_20CM_2_51_8]
MRERAEYQRRLLNPRVFNPPKTSLVIGASTSLFEKEPGPQSWFPGEPTIRITFQVALRTSAQPRSHIIHLRRSLIEENLGKNTLPC